MIIFDLLIYYLAAYFDQNLNLLKWSTPLSRSYYAVGLAIRERYTYSSPRVAFPMGIAYSPKFLYFLSRRWVIADKSFYEL
jgi:hypothetical protein